jgi:hypothetical protein
MVSEEGGCNFGFVDELQKYSEGLKGWLVGWLAERNRNVGKCGETDGTDMCGRTRGIYL